MVRPPGSLEREIITEFTVDMRNVRRTIEEVING